MSNLAVDGELASLLEPTDRFVGGRAELAVSVDGLTETIEQVHFKGVCMMRTASPVIIGLVSFSTSPGKSGPAGSASDVCAEDNL